MLFQVDLSVLPYVRLSQLAVRRRLLLGLYSSLSEVKIPRIYCALIGFEVLYVIMYKSNRHKLSAHFLLLLTTYAQTYSFTPTKNNHQACVRAFSRSIPYLRTDDRRARLLN